MNEEDRTVDQILGSIVEVEDTLFGGADAGEIAFLPSKEAIPKGALRAYVFQYDVDCGFQETVILENNLRGAVEMCLKAQEGMDINNYGPIDKITEKPLKPSILLDSGILV